MRDSGAAFARTCSRLSPPRALAGAALALALASSAATADAPKLEVVGLEGRTQSLAAADLLALQPHEVSVTDPHGKQPARYRGVPLLSVLALVGAPVGEALRGKGLALHVRAEASDGYVAAFSLAELDAGFGTTDALVAFERDGQPLPTDVGPFRLVVPSDSRGGRWVRGLVKLRLLD